MDDSAEDNSLTHSTPLRQSTPPAPAPVPAPLPAPDPAPVPAPMPVPAPAPAHVPVPSDPLSPALRQTIAAIDLPAANKPTTATNPSQDSDEN
ncbi:hypothetical protein Pcinc_007519 [Petrolisthes cinctipes]|uniref:Uncharacterized protein n=1 Tax=Petrolisthes cinctipes TaxID=88211 RepID=A0AAE1GAU3_PETCI|nr:hypothetical protein Pcinc_007519 [Petrolisthes cinctipes]